MLAMKMKPIKWFSRVNQSHKTGKIRVETIFSLGKHLKLHYLRFQVFYPLLTTAICQSLTPINPDKLFFKQESIHSLPLWSHCSDRWLAADRNLIPPACLEHNSPPPARPLRQGNGLLNYVKVNSRRWQWDTVAGAPNRPLWSNSEFMRRRVSYLVDSSQGALPCEPVDSPYVCRTFSDLPPRARPSVVRYWQNWVKWSDDICGFCY